MLSSKGFAFVPILLITALILGSVGSITVFKAVKKQNKGLTNTVSLNTSQKEESVTSSEDKPTFPQNGLSTNENLSKDETNNQNINSNDYEDSQNDDCPKPNTWAIYLTEDQTNQFLSKYAGKYGYAGYTIEGGHIKYYNSGITLDLKLNNNREFIAELVLVGGGTSVAVTSIKSVGVNNLSKIELGIIKITLNNANKLVWKFVSKEYQEMFKYIQLQDNILKLFFYTSEYLNCVQNQ